MYQQLGVTNVSSATSAARAKSHSEPSVVTVESNRLPIAGTKVFPKVEQRNFPGEHPHRSLLTVKLRVVQDSNQRHVYEVAFRTYSRSPRWPQRCDVCQFSPRPGRHKQLFLYRPCCSRPD